MPYKVNEDKILFTQLGEDAVVFDKENNEYLSLNATLCAIFKGIKDGNNTETIISDLLEEYEIDPETCRTQVLQSIEILKEKDFITES